MDFLLTPAEFPEYDVEQARWLGNLFFTIEQNGQQTSMDTGSSADVRELGIGDDTIRVTYDRDSQSERGIKGLSLRETYQIRKEGIRWTIEVSNRSDCDLVLKKLAIPLFMNQYFRKGNYFKYEKCVLRHTCIAHHHSYVYWSKSSGSMPILYLLALDDTPLGHFSRERSDRNFGHRASMETAFEGCVYVYPVHERTDCSHLESSELHLKPGQSRAFTFLLGMADSFEQMDEQIVRAGGLVVKAVPGMCAPVSEDVHLLIRSDVAPDVCMDEKDDVLLETRESNGWFVARIRLGGYGVRNVSLKKGDTCMTLQLFGLEAPGDIIRKQAAFIVANQFETDNSDPCYHGLLMWDMTVKHRINSSCNPFGPNWWAGGSDEIGLVSGLFLSAKNLYQPDEGQIRVLHAYLKDFVEERLTEQPGYRVHRMVPWFEMFDPWKERGADDVWRAFNYVHVINTYCNMHRIAKKYSYDFLEKPVYYIKQAYSYAKGMFSYWMFPEGVGATEYGNMGELHLALSLSDALREEGLFEEASWIDETVRTKAQYFAAQEFPYGSEMAYDSTAFEAVYAYGKAIDDTRVMEKTMNAALANRGRQPIWYLYRTDLRQMGDGSWNVSYMTQLGAYPLYDWLFGQKQFSTELIEAWYASYLAGWSIYNSGGYWSEEPENQGASGWIVDGYMGHFTGMRNERSPYVKGLVPMSGESALGFFGALQIAAAAVVDHPVLGRYGFGCRLEERDGAEAIVPTDGLGVRIHHIADEWSVELDRDRVKEAVWDGRHLRLSIENLTKDDHTLLLMVERDGPEADTH